MKQTPIHDTPNMDVLGLIPIDSTNIIEIGCSSGSLAREFKARFQTAHWTGVEIDPSYAVLAERFCNTVLVKDIEKCNEDFYQGFSTCDCWVFADVLEHLRDPWSVIRLIRSVIPKNGSLVVCIPNAQHWTIVGNLAIGYFRYEDSGLYDRTHLRWFTKQSMVELLESGGFKIAEFKPRVWNVPNQRILAHIGAIAAEIGVDPNAAMQDAIPEQYVLRAVPV